MEAHLVTFLGVVLCADPFSTTVPSLPPSENSELDLAAIATSAIARYTSDESAPGGVVAITQDGVIAFEKGFGLANLDFQIPNAPDTVLDIGSTSKQFTAAAILLLALEEKITLDDALTDHVLELPPIYAKVTIRHLLHHTSGARDYLPLLALDGHPDSDWTTGADALEALRRQRGLCFEPGTFHEYSNSGYFLLAQIVERVSGQSFAEFAAERFFQPLGMLDTHVHDDRNRVVRRRATSYQPIGDGKFAQHTSGYEQTGDGAVMTTVRDLLAWAENFASGTVGGPEFLAAMNARGALDDGTPLGYGMGLFHGELQGPSGSVPIVSHGGAWVGYRAELLRIPRVDGKRYAIAVLMNRGDGNPSGIALSIASSIVGKPNPATMESDAVDIAVESLEPMIGEYRCAADESLLSLRSEAGRLLLVGAGSRSTLVARSTDTFVRPQDGALVLVRWPKDEVTAGFTLQANDGTRVYEKFQRWTPGQDELASFVGHYTSDEVGATLDVTASDAGELRFAMSRNFVTTVTPTAQDVFDMPGGAFRFTRDAAGQPVDCEIRMRGIAGLRFTRAR